VVETVEEKSLMRRILLALLVVYFGGYVAFRTVNAETWAKDNQVYVIFPDTSFGKLAYYVWRPLSYVDALLTGMGFHIGPHQET
jgi:hypothetical protein